MPDEITKEINGYFINPIIFTQKFVKSCDVCVCSGECCYYGVYTDEKEHDLILSIQDRIISTMDDSQTKDVSNWFEEPQEDNDFDSGIAYGTEIYNGKCVFLDQQGYCSLQKIAMQAGEDKWKYKPLYCILFPLVIYNDAITVDDDHLNRLHYCNKSENQSSTVFDCCAEELRYLLGNDGFYELEEYKTEYLNMKRS
ncbi:MAG: DUF3109 family protein [Melioribacteraceae bacterium]|nr:DUF3109 family protein [Melioribacteraceae bacterium]MCF8264438.1 DUF3109 family protein [Melioribacteraceae bacterium]MCF8432219.1 DUF3109 family protein [Melioribacteraceae bacterium]